MSETTSAYGKKLKHPLWQKKRLEIFQRDKFTCCYCGSTDETLHVHHKEYFFGNDVWDYPDDNFLTLCEHCHDALEYCKKSGYNITNCYLLKTIDGEKSHLLCSSDRDICVLWEFCESGYLNKKKIVVVLPNNIMEIFSTFLKENTKNG